MFEITNLSPDQVAALKASSVRTKYPFAAMDNIGDSFAVPFSGPVEYKRIRNILTTLAHGERRKGRGQFMTRTQDDHIIVVRVG
jgi:hypothetical protein